MELQPVNDEFCWCCLRGNLPNNRLYRCVKCGLYCHLQCCDPIILEALNDSEEKEFVCFKCQKCRGCGTEVCFYGKWEHVLVDNEKVTCCEECQENYREGLYCNVCLKTMDNEELKEKCQFMMEFQNFIGFYALLCPRRSPDYQLDYPKIHPSTMDFETF